MPMKTSDEKKSHRDRSKIQLEDLLVENAPAWKENIDWQKVMNEFLED